MHNPDSSNERKRHHLGSVHQDKTLFHNFVTKYLQVN